MKKYILILAAVSLVAVTKANAQGYFNFANGAAGVNAPVTETDGTTKLAGSAYLADYYWGPAGTVNPNSLTAGGLSQAFSTGGNAGYFFGGHAVVSGQTGTVTLQVRAWRASDGASWAAASGVNGAHVGQGNLIQFALGASPAADPPLVGIQAFSLTTVGPEPATIALGLMGAGALFIRRRKA